MVTDDITDPLETIVGLLKSSSTGLGTTGYEITDDALTGLTIANGDILISYTMGREELRSQLGGSQDLDVIITCDRFKPLEEEWIGFSTKKQTVKITITVNVVDKWSATGTGKKTLTADLVRYKAENAIRKFVKDNTNAPGGSIGIWKFVGSKNEEDISVKPTLFKTVIETEALVFYNPHLGETERLTNGGFETGSLPPWEDEPYDPCGMGGHCEVTTEAAKSGTYGATIPGSSQSKLKYGIQLDVSQIYSWTVQARSKDATGSLSCEIYYSDSSHIEWVESLTSAWLKIDLKSHAQAGKSVSFFRFYAPTLSDILIDEVSLLAAGI